MNLTILSKLLAAAAAAATPFCLGIAMPASAARPPGVPPCHVGSLAYPTIQSAVDNPLCESINVPAGTFDGSVYITRDVEIRGAGPGLTIVNGTGGPVFKISSPVLPSGELVTSYFVNLKGMTITGGKPDDVAP